MEEEHALLLTGDQLVSLYVLLSRQEADLDGRQREVLAAVARLLYARLSVSEMEDIDSHYRSLGPAL